MGCVYDSTMLGDDLLRGELVFLDVLEREDIEVVGPWYRSLSLLQYLRNNVIYPQTMQDEYDWFDNERKQSGRYGFGIKRLDNGEIIGGVGLFDVNAQVRSCTFGISLGEQAVWGKGYGTDATRVALRYAFLELNMNRVELRVYDYNNRGIRAYEKAGFEQEGRLREAVYRDGRYWDELVMGILRADWMKENGEQFGLGPKNRLPAADPSTNVVVRRKRRTPKKGRPGD